MKASFVRSGIAHPSKFGFFPFSIYALPTSHPSTLNRWRALCSTSTYLFRIHSLTIDTKTELIFSIRACNMLQCYCRLFKIHKAHVTSTSDPPDSVVSHASDNAQQGQFHFSAALPYHRNLQDILTFRKSSLKPIT